MEAINTLSKCDNLASIGDINPQLSFLVGMLLHLIRLCVNNVNDACFGKAYDLLYLSLMLYVEW